MIRLAQEDQQAAAAAADLVHGAASGFDLVAAAITIGAVLLVALIVHVLFGSILRRMSKRGGDRVRWGAILAGSLRRPLVATVWIIAGLALADLLVDLTAHLMPGNADVSQLTTAMKTDVLPPARVIVIVLALTLFLTSLTRGFQHELERQLAEQNGTGVTAVQGLGSMVVGLIWVLGILSALNGVGVDTTAVLAVLGLSSAGLAFAAKDLLGNFFGGVMLLFNRPFETGDAVSVKGVDGTIERIGLYATQIRGSDKRLVWIPNQTFTAAIVENPSRRTHRRFAETIGLRYDDLEATPAVMDALRALLDAEQGFDQTQARRVSLAGYGPSSVDIALLAYSADTGSDDFEALRARVLLAVADVVHGQGANFAFPTMTIDQPAKRD